MRLPLNGPQAIFCLAAAVAAAAIIDPIVERMSNAGVFGAGSFTDRSNLDVIPAISVACGLSLLFVCLSAWRLLSHKSYAPEWVRASSRAVNRHSAFAFAGPVFVTQLGVLFVMETLEQIVVAGHPMGGLIWLGGPTAVSLLLHAAGCVASTWLLWRALHWSAGTLAQAICWALRILAQTMVGAPKIHVRAWRTERPRFIEPFLRRLKGRAPPYCLSP